MLQVSAIGSLAGALGSLYATEKWSFIAARCFTFGHGSRKNVPPQFRRFFGTVASATTSDNFAGSIRRWNDSNFAVLRSIPTVCSLCALTVKKQKNEIVAGSASKYCPLNGRYTVSLLLELGVTFCGFCPLVYQELSEARRCICSSPLPFILQLLAVSPPPIRAAKTLGESRQKCSEKTTTIIAKQI